LKVERCFNLRVLPPRLGQPGALKELMVHDLPELRVLPDLSGLTTLRSSEISLCCALEALPSGFGEMMALKKLTIYRLDQLRSLSDIFVLTALDCSMIADCGHNSFGRF
jgi:hypothetical protein